MCTVIAWNGTMPQGFLTRILVEAESRGRDSTGFAFRNADGKTQVYRQAISATIFTKHHQKYIGEARRSKIGIAHTRRASPSMPVNDSNAHPFVFRKVIYAHNGKVDNWKQVKEAWEGDERVHADDKAYFKGITTDSQVLGPYLAMRNLTDVTGAMGLVWMIKGDVYCARSKKELVFATIRWTAGEVADEFVCTVVCSTEEIIRKALAALDPKHKIAFTVTYGPINEAEVYKVNPDGLVSEGAIPVAPTNHEDAYSDGTVTGTEGCPVSPPAEASMAAAVPVTVGAGEGGVVQEFPVSLK